MAADRYDEEPLDDAASGASGTPTKADEKLLELALERFKASSEGLADQRKRELDDLDFDAGNHWPTDLLEARKAQRDPSTGDQLPARPSLTIPKLAVPVQQIINGQRSAAIGIVVKPRGAGATQDTAEKINGLIRHIQVESRAQIARGWAYAHAVKCGRGWYRILKEWANDGDWDVDLTIGRILNQASVYPDPFHTMPDASDMKYCLVGEDVPVREFKREWKRKSRINRVGRDTLRSIGDSASGWLTFNSAGELSAVRVAEYWYIVYHERTLCEYEGGISYFEDDPNKPKRGLGKKLRERVVRQPNVKWAKITAVDVLDKNDWEGRFIPIVQVLGREFNVNGKRIYKGMISDAKDAQRSYNYMRSKQVEAVGLAPVAPYTMVEGQDEGYEKMWAQANVMPFSRLLYKPISIAGQAAPPPQRTSASTDIGAITVAVQHADDDMKSITGISDPSLGRSNPADRSGRAIQALQQKTELGTSDFLGNLTDVSMVHEGRILLDLLPHVYDRPGRVATILDEDLETSSQVMLNVPFRVEQNGKPREVGSPRAPGAQMIDLRTGVYRVVVKTAKAFSTQREEAVAMLGEVMAAAPQTAPLLTDVLVENVDAPGFKKLARRFKAMLPPQIQKLEAGEGQFPPEAEAVIANMQSQMEQMQQQLQQAAQAIQGKQIEAQAKAELEQMRMQLQHELEMAKLALEERIALRKIEAGLETAHVSADAKLGAEELRAVERRITQERKLRNDAITTDTELAHDAATEELRANVEREKIAAQRARKD